MSSRPANYENVLFIFPFEMCVCPWREGLGWGVLRTSSFQVCRFHQKQFSDLALQCELYSWNTSCTTLSLYLHYMTVTRDCTFRWCMVTNLSLSESSLKENFHNQVQSQCHFVTLCILLLLRLSRRTQNNEQHEDLSTGYDINSV